MSDAIGTNPPDGAVEGGGVVGEGVEVAAFDVDGTLAAHDCLVPFLRRVGGRMGIARALTRRPIASAVAAMRRDRDRLKEIVVGGVLAGRHVEPVTALGATFAHEIRRDRLRDDVLGRLRWHQRAGHRVVLVSASLDVYLDPLGALLGVDGVLCTIPGRSNGRFSRALEGPNCRGPEKVRRLDGWLARAGLGAARVWAYGDSAGDRELLGRADVATWVNGVLIPEEPGS